VILDTLQFGAAIKKIPVVVGNCTGFAVNRCFFPYNMAACMLADMGLDIYKVAIPSFCSLSLFTFHPLICLHKSRRRGLTSHLRGDIRSPCD
jgi:hypothetical protein